MRLLQLATGPGEMIDLHPHVTVVTGLDPAGRQLLADAVTGLAAGRAVRAVGLLEAHGVLFDLEPAALSLLDIDAADVQPVVTAADLPALHHAPPTAERTAAEGALAEIEERWHAAGERDAVAQSAVVAATAAVERARLAAEQVDEPAAVGLSHEELAVQNAEASDQVRRLSEELAGIDAELEEATAERTEVEVATAGVLAARQAAAVHCSDVAARLDAARMACDPDAGPAAQIAAAELDATEAAVEAEREAEERAAGSPAGEPPADRLARVEAEIEAVERKLAVFGPVDVARVADELEPVRALEDVAPLPEALDLASQLAVLEDDLRSREGRGAEPTGDRAEARARLDAAHEVLVEAEQAVRGPELNRDLVDRLEVVHADLLDAMEKADGRFAGARAQRRVEACREEEYAILDELGLSSYADYMMGSSLFHVDPVKEFALEEARAELAAAEDAWRALDEETDAELARAQQMERRRTLLEEARGFLGGSTSAGSVIDELRSLRIDAEPSAEVMVDLRRALDDAGVVVGDEDLDRDDLLMVAEAWISEVGEAASRERSLRAELASLVEERAEAALGAVAAVNGSGDGRSPEELRMERLELARERHRAAEDRHRAHLEAEQEATALVDELAVAVDRERAAVDAASAAEAALAAAALRESDAIVASDRVAAELAAAEHAVTETSELLQADDSPPEDAEEIRSALASAEAAYALALAAAAEAGDEVSVLAAERNRAKRELAALSDGASPLEVTHLAEEVEWYLLARLAAQRSVSLGGSLPLVLDDALAGLPQEDMEHVLGRLERMSEAVQVIVISDHPATAAWVALAGEDRAAVVRPQADSMV